MLKKNLPGIVSGTPDILFGIFYLAVWINPYWFGVETVLFLVITFGMEFLVVHSYGIFCKIGLSKDPLTKKMKSYFALLGLYSLIGIGFAMAAKSIFPLISFAWLTASKAFTYYGDSLNGQTEELVKKRWGVMCLCYLLSVFLTLMLPLPELGVSYQVRNDAGFTGGGEWEKHPHIALAAGFLYFLALGVYEIISIKRRSEQNVAGN